LFIIHNNNKLHLCALPKTKKSLYTAASVEQIIFKLLFEQFIVFINIAAVQNGNLWHTNCHNETVSTYALI